MRLSEKGHTYALFAIVVITCALGSLSQTATNSMLTGICAEFFIDAGEGQWLTTVYMLVMGITVPVVTFLARRMSVKRLVCLALGLFLAGSAVDLIARTFFTLVLGRVLQAVATGITLPLVQSLAMTCFPRERTARPWASRALPWVRPQYRPHYRRRARRLLGLAQLLRTANRRLGAARVGLRSVGARGGRWQCRRRAGRAVAGAFHARFRRAALGGIECGEHAAVQRGRVGSGAERCLLRGCVPRAAEPYFSSAYLSGRISRPPVPGGVRGPELPVRLIHGHHAHRSLVRAGHLRALGARCPASCSCRLR